MKMIHRRDFLELVRDGILATTIPDLDPRSSGFAGCCQASIRIDLDKLIAPISANLYGQFIEHLGRCIYGGIYEEGSSLSDQNGFRLDVLEKVKRLAPTLLRYPGGTVTKIYHWMDGVGPKAERPRRPNLIWGGEESNRFGTGEFVSYCRLIGAAPFLVTNMANGTPEEAANWVEYCNGTGNTRYVDLRRAHGFSQPHSVKYWGLGNEEHGESDPGHLQEPEAYVREAWQFAKLMKLQDPSIKLILVGDDETWNSKVLKELHPVCDFLSLHFYAHSLQRSYSSLFENIAGFEKRLEKTKSILESVPKEVQEFSPWYRFPPRGQPVQLAIDEWGIWEKEGTGSRVLETTYSWKHALGTATMLNLFHRHADVIGLATWAQMVNVLGPIMTNRKGSICQTVFYPLELYRRYCRGWGVHVQVESDSLNSIADQDVPALDAAASYDNKERALTLTAVNRHPSASISVGIEMVGGQPPISKVLYELTAPSCESANSLEAANQDVVTLKSKRESGGEASCVLAPRSINLCQYKL